MVSIGNIWDQTVLFVRERFGAILPIAFLTLFVPSVVTGSLQGLGPTATPGVAAMLGMLTLAATLVALWGQLALVGLAADPMPAAEARTRATRRFGPLIGVSLLLMVGLFVLTLPVFGILAAAGFDFAALRTGVPPTDMPEGTGWALLYMLVLVPLLLWVLARLLPLTPVVLFERRGARAIGRAFALTRGLALKLVGVLLLYVVVSGVAAGAAQFVFGSILRLVAGGDGPVTVADVLTAVAVAAVSAALSVLSSGFIGKLYRALAGTPHEDVFA